MDNLYKDIEERIEEGESKEEILKKVNNILDAIANADKLRNEKDNYWLNQDNGFTLDTSSWQVRDKKANGNYKILSKFDDERDLFLCENLNNGKQYLFDRDTIIYLKTVDDQDCKFVYVGTHLGTFDEYDIIRIK